MIINSMTPTPAIKSQPASLPLLFHLHTSYTFHKISMKTSSVDAGINR